MKNSQQDPQHNPDTVPDMSPDINGSSLMNASNESTRNESVVMGHIHSLGEQIAKQLKEWRINAAG